MLLYDVGMKTVVVVQIIKYTAEDNAEVEVLKEVLAKTKEILNNINKVVAEAQNKSFNKIDNDRGVPTVLIILRSYLFHKTKESC